MKKSQIWFLSLQTNCWPGHPILAATSIMKHDATFDAAGNKTEIKPTKDYPRKRNSVCFGYMLRLRMELKVYTEWLHVTTINVSNTENVINYR